MASAQQSFRSRVEYKKSKELEEARKAGQVAPEQDEEGNDINPHIPQYIAKAPWYLNANAPSLKHQKAQHLRDAPATGPSALEAWYPRGSQSVAQGRPQSVFKKGACTNCGATTHSAKSCLERPRAKGARWTGRGLRPDDVVAEVRLDWEGKRDRWNGYDPRSYAQVIKRHEALEVERRELKQADLDQRAAASSANVPSAALERKDDEAHNDDSGGESEYKLTADGEVMAHEKDVDTKGTARNLRIREDTAKYLRNLDLKSAYYDPKTRSMRQDPTPGVAADDKDYAGDNFVRFSGDVAQFAQLELHALKAGQEGRDVPHLQADPSLAEMLHKEYRKRREKLERVRQDAIVERYGSSAVGANPMSAFIIDTGHAGDDVLRTALEQEQIRALELDPALLEQSEAYIEYTEDGEPLRTTSTSSPQRAGPSSLDNDAVMNNHTAAWGTYSGENGVPGYACCQSVVQRSYCTGLDGIAALAASKMATNSNSSAVDVQPPPSDLAKGKRSREVVRNELRNVDAAALEDELEAFRRSRKRFDDPLAHPTE